MISDSVAADVADGATAARGDIAALKAHPAFGLAARRSAECSVELYRSGRLVGWILGDRARALFGFVVMHLHVSRDPDDPRSGITAARVRQFCFEHGLCSPGRAGAMLALMQTAGYLAPAPGAEDRRVRRLEPTHKLLALQQERLRAQFDAAAHVIPEARAVAANLSRPEFQNALTRGLAAHFVDGFRLLHHAPALRLFAERSGGIVIVYALMLTSASKDFPSAGPVDVSIAPMARRFGVSRVHILRMLRDAEAQGLIVRGGDAGGFCISADLREAVRDFTAAMFLLLREGLRNALIDLERSDSK